MIAPPFPIVLRRLVGPSANAREGLCRGEIVHHHTTDAPKTDGSAPSGDGFLFINATAPRSCNPKPPHPLR
jgi:hypothetical protein